MWYGHSLDDVDNVKENEEMYEMQRCIYIYMYIYIDHLVEDPLQGACRKGDVAQAYRHSNSIQIPSVLPDHVRIAYSNTIVSYS